ncbi:MAG TPA: polymer-forming cytoskeletal protein [Candidatus Methylacidiphilales bacterium]
MKKSKQREVSCPHCQAAQSEPEGAISTNCRVCGKYFKLGGIREQRATRAPKTNREVICVKCGAPNLVASAALSTQCIRCLHYLELGDKVVRGVQTGKLFAYDDVVFAEGCSFKGMEATGRRIEVRGKVFSKLRAMSEIVAIDGSQLSGELYAPLIRIERGAKIKVQTIECGTLHVAGDAEISGSLDASEIILSDGASFTGKLKLPDARLKVEAGAKTRFDTVTCRELIVEGRVDLADSLFAEKVTVSGAGFLAANRIYASSIEVSPGGFLQGLIEKYVPKELPDETPPQAEAA